MSRVTRAKGAAELLSLSAVGLALLGVQLVDLRRAERGRVALEPGRDFLGRGSE